MNMSQRVYKIEGDVNIIKTKLNYMEKAIYLILIILAAEAGIPLVF